MDAWKDVVISNDFVKKATVGQVLALSLPDTAEENDIQGKLHDALGKEIGTEGGYDKIINWLDKHMGRDDVSDTIDKIRDFMEYRRTDGQSVKDFLAGFDWVHPSLPNTTIKTTKLTALTSMIHQKGHF